MEFLEKDLEEILEKTTEEERLDRGLYLFGKCKRQLRIGNYGIADLVYYSTARDTPFGEPYLLIQVCELKKDKIGISAFLQACRYAKGIKEFLEKRMFLGRYKVEVVLIGKTIDTTGSFCFLPSLFNGDGENSFEVSNYTYYYCINGITFKSENNYYLKENGFNLTKK